MNDRKTKKWRFTILGSKHSPKRCSNKRFSPADEFGLFVTYQRANDPLKLHIGPDGSFAAFDGDDEVVAEGKGAHDLYAILVDKTAPARRQVSPHRPARRHSA
jgi:hypothetical protein